MSASPSRKFLANCNNNLTRNNSSPDKMPLFFAPANMGDTASRLALNLNSPLLSIKSSHSRNKSSRFINESKSSQGVKFDKTSSPNSPRKFSRKGSKFLSSSNISIMLLSSRIYFFSPLKCEKSIMPFDCNKSLT